MQIVASARYETELNDILDFIGCDSPANALAFAKGLDAKITELTNFPHKYRQSTKTTNQNVRELIFKGFVVPYRINKTLERIEILGIFSQNLWEL